MGSVGDILSDDANRPDFYLCHERHDKEDLPIAVGDYRVHFFESALMLPEEPSASFIAGFVEAPNFIDIDGAQQIAGVLHSEVILAPAVGSVHVLHFIA